MVGLVGDSSTYVTLGTYDPVEMDDVEDYDAPTVSFVWTGTPPILPVVHITDSSYVWLYNMDLITEDPASVDAILIDGTGPSSWNNLYFYRVTVSGEFQTSFHVAAPPALELGFNLLELWRCDFSYALNAMLIDGDVATIGGTKSHYQLTITESTFGYTGINAVPGGACLRVQSVDLVYIYNNAFVACGYYSTTNAPDAIELQNSQDTAISWNLIRDMDAPVSLTEGRAIVIRPNCERGWIDHNLVQNVKHHALEFVAPSTDGASLGFTNSWYVGYNLFEMRIASTPTISVKSTGCGSNCFRDLHFAQNTIYSREAGIVFACGGVNGCPETSVLNGVFYNPNCTLASNAAIVYVIAQANATIVGNVHVRNANFKCPLLKVAASSYDSVESLYASGYETYIGLQYGANFSAPNAIMQRRSNH